MAMLRCKRCLNQWNYLGTRKGIQRVTCSACGLSMVFERASALYEKHELEKEKKSRATTPKTAQHNKPIPQPAHIGESKNE